MKRYMMICFVVLQPMMIGMHIQRDEIREDYLIKKMEVFRGIRERERQERMKSSSSEDMSTDKSTNESMSRSSSGSFSSLPIPIQQKLINVPINSLVGSPQK
jgi:hypothetical protein